MKRPALLLLLLVPVTAYAASQRFIAQGAAVERRGISISATIHTSLGSCDTIDIRGVSDIAIEIPAGVTSLTFYGAHSEAGTYGAIYDHDGTAATITTTAGRWYTFPPSVFPHSFIKIQSAGSTGTAKLVGKT